jgi:type IV fimbrial biogenesis protein FimT
MNKMSGVTLFEMIVVMGIVAILAAVGIPSFKYVTNSNRVASEGNGLLGDLQFARAEAIKEGQTVTACVSSNGTSCLASNTNWASGWIVFTDVNGDQTVETGDTVWRVQAAFSGTDSFVASNSVSAITFNREGFASGLPNGTLITLHTSPVSNSSTRCLSVGLIGMMSIMPYGTVNGITCS